MVGNNINRHFRHLSKKSVWNQLIYLLVVHKVWLLSVTAVSSIKVNPASSAASLWDFTSSAAWWCWLVQNTSQVCALYAVLDPVYEGWKNSSIYLEFNLVLNSIMFTSGHNWGCWSNLGNWNQTGPSENTKHLLTFINSL